MNPANDFGTVITISSFEVRFAPGFWLLAPIYKFKSMKPISMLSVMHFNFYSNVLLM